MPIYVQWKGSEALLRRTREIQAAAKPGSPQILKAQSDIRKIVVEDHTRMLLAGEDRFGKPLVPLAPSTLKQRKGTGPPLVPRGQLSRFITNFEALWISAQGLTTLVCRYKDILSKKGRPFAQFHLLGMGYNPKRDVGGISRKGWALVIARHKQFVKDIATKKG